MSFSSDNALQSNQLSISIDFPPVNSPNFLDAISLDRKRIVDSVNKKIGSLYLTQELASFKQYFTPGNPQVTRNGYRTVFDLVSLNGGNIAGGATVAFAHNINGLSSSVIVYAGCTSTDPIYFSVMYPDVYLDATNVNFTNPLASAITNCYVVAEYLKN